ncbi:MAG: hypothetical protein AAB874_03745, partial [Patescibacteria group bacterium]
VEAWVNSPTHRENLLRGDYQDIGFAVVNGVLNGEETTLVVQMFGKRLTQLTAVQNTRQAEIKPSIATDQVLAQTPEVTQPTLIPQTSPISSPIMVSEVQPSMPPVLIAQSKSVAKNPLFDLPHVSKQIIFVLTTILMIIMVSDALYIWRNKVYRIGGKTLAHLSFLFVITGIVWVMSFGVIL